jgi:hypothetical protein
MFDMPNYKCFKNFYFPSEAVCDIQSEIQAKFTELEQTKWLPIAKELAGEDPFHFLRAYSPGSYEFIMFTMSVYQYY